jgi:K+-transporting ATPase KdpF subunit
LVGSRAERVTGIVDLAAAQVVRRIDGAAMSVLDRLALIGALLLGIYLLVALLKPEYFE